VNERPKIAWSVVKEFEENGIVVEVSVSDTRTPRYNARVVRRNERGAIPFLQLRTEGQGKVRIVSIAKTVEKLLSEAEQFVESEVQKIEDAYIDQRIERESRQVEREGKKRRPGYKQHGAAEKALKNSD